MAKQAIEGKRMNGFWKDPHELTIIGLDTDDGPEHPLYDERIKRAISESRVLNIMVHGVIEPVIVRKNGDVVEVVAGRGRVRHARIANERLVAQGSPPIEVPVIVRRGSDEDLLKASIIENEHRDDDDLQAKLIKLSRLLQTGSSTADCADAFDVTSQTIKNWICLMEAGPEVKKAVSQGLLSATAGAKLAALPRIEQAAAVAEATANGKASVVQAEQIAKAKKKNTASGASEPTIMVPKKRLIRKVLESEEFESLPWTPVQALKWSLGEMAPERIKGLTALLREVEEKTA